MSQSSQKRITPTERFILDIGPHASSEVIAALGPNISILQKMYRRDANDFNLNIETMAADAMIKRKDNWGTILEIPKPSDEKTRKGLEELGVQFQEVIDTVLVRVKCPPGWELRRDGNDSRNRQLVNASGQKIASVWLKNTLYDYNGWINLV